MPANTLKTFGQNKSLAEAALVIIGLDGLIHFDHKDIIFDLFYLLRTIHPFQ